MSELRDAIAAAIDASCWAESSEYTPGGCGCDGFPCAHDVATLATERVLAVLDEHTRDEWGVARRHSAHGPWMFERTGSVALADEKIADCLAVYGYDHVTVARASRRVTAWEPVEEETT